jgi:hypothetical protein
MRTPRRPPAAQERAGPELSRRDFLIAHPKIDQAARRAADEALAEWIRAPDTLKPVTASDVWFVAWAASVRSAMRAALRRCD